MCLFCTGLAPSGRSDPLEQLSTPAKRHFRAQDIFALQQASDVQISPDGRHVAYIRIAGDIMTDRRISTLWVVDVAGGAPRMVTAEKVTDPRWAPDGQSLAYLAKDLAGKTQIFTVSLITGASRQVSSCPENPEAIAWSPDGHWLAFQAFVPQPEQKMASALGKPANASWAPPLHFSTERQITVDGSGFLAPGRMHLFVVSIGGAPLAN